MLLQIVGTFLTGWFVWIAAAAPPFFHDSLGTMIGRAVVLALLAWIWSATMLAGGLWLTWARGRGVHG